jgi:hypothetical protein
MVKRSRTFAEVKAKRDGVEVTFIVSRRVNHPRIVRTLDLTARRIVHVLAITGVADVDEQVQSWLAEAYLNSPPLGVKLSAFGPKAARGDSDRWLDQPCCARGDGEPDRSCR